MPRGNCEIPCQIDTLTKETELIQQHHCNDRNGTIAQGEDSLIYGLQEKKVFI